METAAVLHLVYLERKVLDVETRNLGLFDEYFRTRRAWYEARMRKLATDNAGKLVQHGSDDGQRATVQPASDDHGPSDTSIRDEVAIAESAQPEKLRGDGD